MKTEHLALLGQVLAAIENDTLILPTLPDVAIKLQKLIDDPNVSADEIVLTLSGDPFISTQLIKTANSAIFADKRTVNNVRGAISRLGYRQVRNLVLAITMSKMFQAKNPVILKLLKASWERSREVAAVSYVLAAHQPHFSPDQALLAGLIHQIGILPLCLHLEQKHLQITEETVDELLQKFSATIGMKLLKKWNFPQELIAVIGEYDNIKRDSHHMPRADYTDVITLANLLTPAHAETPWNEVAALQRLGLSAEECQTFVTGHSERIDSVAEMLGIFPPSRQQAKNPATTSSPLQQKSNPSPDAGKPDKTAGMPPSILTRFIAFWEKTFARKPA